MAGSIGFRSISSARTIGKGRRDKVKGSFPTAVSPIILPYRYRYQAVKAAYDLV